MAGVKIDTADSGAAALDRIAAGDYDAVVTDIKMPGMDGLELLAVLGGWDVGAPALPRGRRHPARRHRSAPPDVENALYVVYRPL
jgi:CheY-like chemotaxis protein